MDRIEVKTKAAAEKAIKEGRPIHIVGGKFALTLVGLAGIDIHVSADVSISLTDTRGVLVAKAASSPRIETWGTSSPLIETRETSSPRIVTWGTSSPLIETWETSSPSIETRETSSPLIETRETSSPRIVTRETSSPLIETRETSSPSINNSDSPVPLIFLSGFRWRIAISATRMAIGCQDHELARWWSFDDRLIERMDSHALEFWRANKAHLQAICAATGRVATAEAVEA
ncbi:hypothetical protein [Sphingobium sp. CFD-1]|uniref:hypothetical protein n=1 Tax=Sphingobium sp. CFD-1 TaxID=2878545 RepID=UPI00214BB003|nr:hypothetical protein [Sphingobium sp. CFD-1]